MEFTAMIPARLGSKRIPRKNIRYMLDKPLIQYPIELALQCGKFTDVWVNTEDEGLGKFAESTGAKFHKRPLELSGDTATNRDFTFEFLQKHECDYVVMINPTSPLLRQKTLEDFLDFVGNSDFDTVLSTVSNKAETFYQGKPLNFTYSEKINSQLLPPIDEVVWAVTAWKRETFIALQESGINPIFGGKVGFYAIPKDESCDLDTPEDWSIAEGILYSRLLNKTNEKERYLEI